MDDIVATHNPGPQSNGMTQAWARALGNIAPLARQTDLTLPSLIDQLAEKFADRPAIETHEGVLTYCTLARRKNQYARWAIEQGLCPGQRVCLMMRNCPDYVAIWLGLTQIGLVVGLINTNLQGSALVQAVGCISATHIIADEGGMAQLLAVQNRLDTAMKLWIQDEPSQAANPIDPDHYNGDPLEPSGVHLASSKHTALLIFTSGTTGLPKAALLSHYRILEWSLWFAGMMDSNAADRLYNCLPLYHSTGGVAALGAILINGGTIVLRERFSVTQFWSDIVKARCTIFLYIGELCRYLVNALPQDEEIAHRLRLCCGNGLRAGVWERFTARFHIPHVLEFYAATEGNVALYNYDGPPGALGRVPAYLGHRFGIALLACDAETGEPHRTPEGHYLRCAPGDVGEAIGKIEQPATGRPGVFEGYTDAAATSRKVLRDVFTPGDAWFRTGDLMRKDQAGYFYFVDRLGDTFRWKGENVSTTQVAEAIGGCRGVTAAVVYGVAIPGADGRAGMAAITIDCHFVPAQLYALLDHELPAYARPKFLRICRHLQTTATFKPVKAALAREGTDFDQTDGALYVEDAELRTYRLLRGHEI